MVGWIVGKLKWLLIVAAIGGPIVAFVSWQDGVRRRDVIDHGVDATAAIDHATRTTRRRGGISYKVDLSWTDAAGKARSAKGVAISRDYAEAIIADDKIVVEDTRIRYLADPGETENLIIVDDESEQENTDHEMIYLGAGAGVVGIIGAGLMLLAGRRREKGLA